MTEPLSFMRDVGLLRQGPSKRKFTRTDLDKAAPGATAENRTRQRSVAAGSHLLYIGPTHSGAPNEPQARRSRMATWRSGYAAVCKTVYAGSIPAVASTRTRSCPPFTDFQTPFFPPKATAWNIRSRAGRVRTYFPYRHAIPHLLLCGKHLFSHWYTKIILVPKGIRRRNHDHPHSHDLVCGPAG